MIIATQSRRFSPLLKGEMLSVFFFFVFCVWFGVLCLFFSVLLFSGSLFENIFGSELLFLGVMVGLVFFDSVLPRLLFYYLVFSLPKMSRKNSLHVRICCFGFFVLFLLVFRRRRLFVFVFVVFSREKAQG